MKAKFKLNMTFLALLVIGSNGKNEGAISTIVATNNSNLELSEKAVYIDRAKFSEAEIDDKYPLLTAASDTIPSQLTILTENGMNHLKTGICIHY